MTLIGALIGGMLAVTSALVVAAPANAQYAEGGSGLYKGAIDWFEWGAGNTTIPAAGMTRTNTRTVAGQTLATTCVLSNVSGNMVSYRSGSWRGDALDDLYNVGGTGVANQMVTGIANRDAGGAGSFRFACSAALDGVPVPLQGLVVADAEASNIAVDSFAGEYVQARPEQPATWRIIDRFRSAGCTTNTQATRSADGTLRFASSARECNFLNNAWAGPIAVGFMEGATSAVVSLQGGGNSAVALGVVLPADFGDAPASYGEAGALFEPTWQGGTVPVGTTAVSGTGFALATQGQPATRLGAIVDADTEYQPSADALADDITGQADEDAIEPPGTINVTPGGTYTLDDVSCTGPGYVSGWIDWNHNGVFDEGERSGIVECTGTSVDLTWTVPADTVPSIGADKTFLRLRIAADEAAVGSPTGMTTSGEVEDYALNVALPALSIQKTSDATVDSRPGDVVTYTVSATNTGASAYTAEFPAVVFDDLSGVLDDATFNDDASSSQPGDLAYASPLLSWAGALGVGETVELTYTTTLQAGGDGNVRNVAWIPGDPENPQPPACEPPADGVDPVTGEACAVVEFPLPRLTIEKTANRTELPAVGDTVEYTIVVTNVGPGTYTADAPATATDDLSNVLDAATFNDDAAASSGSLSYTEPTLSWSGALDPNESATITYSVTYTGEGDQNLRNLACVPESETATGAANCDLVQIPGAALTQWKQVEASSDPVVAGTVLTYTLFFQNSGETAATIDAIDYLEFVLDDADVTTEPVADAPLAATRSGDQISITGSLPSGETASVSYQVTIRPDGSRGDDVASNFLLNSNEEPPTGPECTPSDAQLPDCTSTPVTAIQYTKSVSASETPVRAGTELTYTITAVNTGATAVDVSRDDDLSDVLDDADLTTDPESDTASVTVDGPDAGLLEIRGTLPVGATATITYTVTVKEQSDRGNNQATNFLVPPGTTPPETCDPEVSQCTTTPILGYTVAKVADVESATPGSVVTYTVTVVNTGNVPFTDDAPASFTDDLTEVLDDAVYNDDITAGGVVDGNTLTWSGALGVGETITVTYSVTVNDPNTGDNVLTNAVVPTTPGGECAPEGECVVNTPVSSFTVVKTSDTESAYPGDVVTYTVTVVNTGAVAYTEASPASFDDDLTAVFDDATYNDDVSAGGSIDGNLLTWSGPLAIGETLQVTYSVTVNDPITGDQSMVNIVVPTAPGGSCEPGGECTTTTPIASYAVTKSADVETALPGDVVTYSVVVTNTSTVDYTAEVPATLTDDLSDVLDDAVYNDDATSGAIVSGSTLTWEGALAAGESVTITYSVTVDDPITGDFTLRNAVTPTGPGGSCDGTCETVTPLASFRVVKSTESNDVLPGGVVEYTISVTNTGQVAYTDADPASFTDDLSDVLDDATYNGDAASTSGAGVTYAAPVLSWAGPLAIGETVTITYSVTVNDPITGDQNLGNTVVTPPGTGGNCEPGSTDPDCVANVPSGSFTIEKSADPGSTLPGGIVTYTVTVRNTGDVAYTDEEPASFTDDLSRVLDDATYNDDISTGGAVVGETLTWSGPLAVGATIQVTYSVTVNDPVTGDFNLRNVVVPSAPGGSCVEDGCVTDTPVASYTVQKSADVIDVTLGGTVTYTIEVTNIGQVPYTADEFPATFNDDLTDVLDDAIYNDDATNGAFVAGEALNWTGALDVGATTTITYSVTVNRPATGDGVLRNAVFPDGPGGACTEEGDCVTETPIATYKVAKVASASTASIGDRVTYTITVTNTGKVDYTDERPASFTDDLTSALQIASYNNDASGGAVYERPILSWAGPLEIGESTTVTYSVTVSKVGEIRNVVVTPDDSGANCAPGSSDPDCSTETTIVPPGLAITGGGAWSGAGIAGILLVGFGLWFARRRREASAVIVADETH